MGAGLQDIASSTHFGKSLQSIISGTNFKKTHKFIVQSWEALNRLQLEVFFKWREGKLPDMKCMHTSEHIYNTVLGIIKAENALQDEISECLNLDNTADDELLYKHIQSLNEELTKKLDGIEDDYEKFINILTQEDEIWKLWHQYIYYDAFYYISLWLSIRQGNWSLRKCINQGHGTNFSCI